MSTGLLSTVGLYLVVAYVIHQHRRANAIRSALGASARSVVGENARTSGVVAGIALPIGIMLSLLVAPLLDGLVYGVRTRDVLSIDGALVLGRWRRRSVRIFRRAGQRAPTSWAPCARAESNAGSAT